MTQEEKAKAYDEALERAEKALEVLGTDKCEGARQIFSLFPELKESEDEDLEEAATKYARKQLSNPDYPTYNDEYEMECAFEAGAQWQKEQLIEKACEWLKENKDHPFIECEDPCLSGYLTDEFIEDFKKAMEE